VGVWLQRAKIGSSLLDATVEGNAAQQRRLTTAADLTPHCPACPSFPSTSETTSNGAASLALSTWCGGGAGVLTWCRGVADVQQAHAVDRGHSHHLLAGIERQLQGRRRAEAGWDRTGQDRTGQDRTGQDRTGQDRTGQDRTGQECPWLAAGPVSAVSAVFFLAGSGARSGSKPPFFALAEPAPARLGARIWLWNRVNGQRRESAGATAAAQHGAQTRAQTTRKHLFSNS